MNRLILPILISSLVGCNPPAKDNSTENSEMPKQVLEETSAAVDSLDQMTSELEFYQYLDSIENLSSLFEKVSNNVSSTKTEEEFYADGCVRGIPKASIKEERLSYHQFVLNDKLSIGEELVVFNNSDSLYLINKGCEYYWIEYFYSMSSDPESSLSDSLLKALQNISQSDDASPIGHEEWTAFIQNEIENGRPIELNKDYVLDESIIGHDFRISKFQKMNSTRLFLRFDYAIGPL